MNKVNVNAFYRFGAKMKEAMTVPLKPILEANFAPNLHVERNLQLVWTSCTMFLTKTEGYNLPETRSKAKEIEELFSTYWECLVKAERQGDKVDKQELFGVFLSRCQSLVNEFETALQYEVSKINAFVIDEKGEK